MRAAGSELGRAALMLLKQHRGTPGQELCHCHTIGWHQRARDGALTIKDSCFREKHRHKELLRGFPQERQIL